MANKVGKANRTRIDDFFKAYTNPKQASLTQVEGNEASFSVYGRLPIASDSLLSAQFTFEPTPSEISSQIDAQTAQQERIKGLVYECYGQRFTEVYAYQVNNGCCFTENPEAIAHQL
jgi:hypothetical protein